MNQLFSRMMRAARLEPALYEEVEADQSSMSQAMLVVVLASVANGIGAIGEGGVIGLFTGTLGALIGWFFWALVTFLIGTKLLAQEQTRSDIGELMRTTGFAAAPGVLRIFGFIPGIGVAIQLVVGVWMLIAFIIAVRQALDYTNPARAIAVCLIGWLGMMLVLAMALAAAGGFEQMFGGGSQSVDTGG
jgi:hypothetical protein